MSTVLRHTVATLGTLPPPTDGTRYELIDGVLLVSHQPHLDHQYTNGEFFGELRTWSRQTGRGRAPFTAGITFSPETAVIPDVVWISDKCYATGFEADGKLHLAPELVVEIISPGTENERRDRELKLALYNREGVEEYWLADYRARTVEVFRRDAEGRLASIGVLGDGDILTSPLLPGFSCPVALLWNPAP